MTDAKNQRKLSERKYLNWENIKQQFRSKAIFTQYKHHEEIELLNVTGTCLDTRIVYPHELDAIDYFISFMQKVFFSRKFRFIIEISDRRDLLKTFDSIEKFKDFLQENYHKRLPKLETQKLFRYANFGICIENPGKELYLIHDGYINGYTHIKKYHYFWNTEKNMNKLRSISKGIKHIDEDLRYIFYQDILRTDDYRLRTVLLHLYIEHYINKIIIKQFGKKIPDVLWKFFKKIQFLKETNTIDSNLFSTCEEINQVRNQIAHNIFHYPFKDFLNLKKIKLKNYFIGIDPEDVNRHNILAVITAVSMEVLNELADIYNKLK